MVQRKFGSYEELATRIPAGELSTLLKVSSSLASTMELAEVLQIAIESVANLLNLGTGAIYTLENENLVLSLANVRAPRPLEIKAKAMIAPVSVPLAPKWFMIKKGICVGRM